MLRLFNTLTKKVEEFKPINPSVVNMYTCGPTVYDYQHIGHMRRYVGDDILIRVLEFNGFKVKQVFNSMDALNISRPDIVMHATDYIKEQILFIQILEQKGFTYAINDGIYFDTSKFPN